MVNNEWCVETTLSETICHFTDGLLAIHTMHVATFATWFHIRIIQNLQISFVPKFHNKRRAYWYLFFQCSSLDSDDGVNAGAGDADAADPTAATTSADTSLRDLNQDTVTQVFIMFYLILFYHVENCPHIPHLFFRLIIVMRLYCTLTVWVLTSGKSNGTEE